MKKTLTNAVIAGWILIGGLGKMDKAVAADSGEPNRKISVFVYNDAQIEQNTLHKALNLLAHILRKAGLEARVLEHSTAEETEQNRVHVFVHILSRQMAEQFGLPTNVLGIAPGRANDIGYPDRGLVYVFDHVAEELTRKPSAADKGQILGHAMAHEIGHLLLHEAAHTPDGIMKANWDVQDMRKMTMGTLNFDADQVARIRAEVVRRNQSVEIASLQQR